MSPTLPPQHRIDDISYRAETITCTCGMVITAPPDRAFHGAHQPLVEAWMAHRRSAGLVTPSFARVMSFRRRTPA